MIKMKYLRFLLIGVATFLCAPAISQPVSKYGTDSIACITNLSLSNEYFKQQNYADAIDPWRWVFNNCPASSKRIYLNGIAMYEKFIEDEKDPAKKKLLVDTLLKIYDQRITHFNEKGFVLGRKGLAVYDYMPEQKEKIKSILKESIEADGAKSGPVVLYKYFQVNTELFAEKKITKEDVIDIYDQVSELIDANLEGDEAENYDKARQNVETFFGPFATCEDLISIYAPRLKSSPDNPAVLKKIVNLFAKKGCNEAAIYMEAAEKLHRIEPSSRSALSLARTYNARNQPAKANTYYSEAVELESSNDKKAGILVEYADFTMRTMKNFSQARTLAQRASSLRPSWGRPWMLIGDIYFSSSTSCSDDFGGASVFWAATDKYQKAKSVDPSVTEEANRKISANTKYYPKQEDVFFLGMKEGDSYTIKCWIGETTTIRTR
jgi:tetratricopeptide (TPR) repeat protein